ncbi:MAG TPA: hypothetical protein V6C81_29305 [Planktothrix sp.]
MSNRWAKRNEELEVRITSQLEVLESLTNLPSGWSWTKAQELDKRITTQLEFHSDLYERLGVKPEPTATKLFNQQVRRGQQIGAIEELKAIKTGNEIKEAASEPSAKLSTEQCGELQALWQLTVNEDSAWFGGQARGLRHNSEGFNRGMVGSFGVRRANGDAGANARLRSTAQAAAPSNDLCAYWQSTT